MMAAAAIQPGAMNGCAAAGIAAQIAVKPKAAVKSDGCGKTLQNILKK